MHMGSGGGVQSEINITPYIDVLLVLLICFMIMSQKMVILANVAHEERGPNRPPGVDNIVLELPDDGRFLINTKPVASDTLGRVLREIFAVRPVKVLFIKSGGQREWGETVRAMDIAKGAGVNVLALAP
jgi:biopolymer transport protein ExbD